MLFRSNKTSTSGFLVARNQLLGGDSNEQIQAMTTTEKNRQPMPHADIFWGATITTITTTIIIIITVIITVIVIVIIIIIIVIIIIKEEEEENEEINENFEIKD